MSEWKIDPPPPAEWHDLLDESTPEPEHGQTVRAVRIYPAGDDGWLSAVMEGTIVHGRPDLGRQGWAMRWTRSMMLDDLSCATWDVNDLTLPFDFDVELPPLAGWERERIYWTSA